MNHRGIIIRKLIEVVNDMAEVTLPPDVFSHWVKVYDYWTNKTYKG